MTNARTNILTAWLEQHVKVIKNDVDGRNLLRKTISSYHEVNGGRPGFGYRVDKKADPGWHEEYFLMDRKPVFSYCIGSDRGMTIGGIALAIGPHFSPLQFSGIMNTQVDSAWSRVRGQ